MHIVNTDVALLLSLADMGKLKVYYNNLEVKLLHTPASADATIVRLFGHSFLQ